MKKINIKLIKEQNNNDQCLEILKKIEDLKGKKGKENELEAAMSEATKLGCIESKASASNRFLKSGDPRLNTSWPKWDSSRDAVTLQKPKETEEDENVRPPNHAIMINVNIGHCKRGCATAVKK